VRNALAAVGIVALFCVTDLVQIHHKWWWLALQVMACAFFFAANCRALSKRPLWMRIPVILLLSGLLAYGTIFSVFISYRIVYEKRVTAPAQVSGRVTDLSGNPISGAHLRSYWCHPQPETRNELEMETKSDEDGLFNFESKRGSNYLRVQADGYAQMHCRRDAEPGLNPGWDFKLAESVCVTGTVRDTRGRAVPGVSVRLAPMIPKGTEATATRFGAGGAPLPTDSEGRFHVTTAAPCLNAISVVIRDRNDHMLQYPVNGCYINLESGKIPGPLEIDLNPAEDYVISGRVTDADGNPARNIFCDIHTRHGVHWYDRSDDEGYFAIDGLDGTGMNTFTVHFSGSHRGQRVKFAIEDVPMNTTNLQAVITDSDPGRKKGRAKTYKMDFDTNVVGSIQGTVVFPDKYHHAMIRIASEPDPDDWYSSTQPHHKQGVLARFFVMHSGGSYQLANVPAGRWYVIAAMNHPCISRYTPVRTEIIEVGEGEEVTTDFDLTPYLDLPYDE
jgi:hypothetical protein